MKKLKEFVQKLNVLELLGPVEFQFGVQKKSLEYECTHISGFSFVHFLEFFEI